MGRGGHQRGWNDRDERGALRQVLRSAKQQSQGRHVDDAASNAEKRREHAGQPAARALILRIRQERLFPQVGGLLEASESAREPGGVGKDECRRQPGGRRIAVGADGTLTGVGSIRRLGGAAAPNIRDKAQ